MIPCAFVCEQRQFLDAVDLHCLESIEQGNCRTGRWQCQSMGCVCGLGAPHKPDRGIVPESPIPQFSGTFLPPLMQTDP